MTRNTPQAVVGTPWWIRLAIYVSVATIGLVMTVLGMAQPEQVDGWLTQSGSIAALIGGLLAAANTGRASDTGRATQLPPVATVESAPPAPALPVYNVPSSGA